MTAPVLAPGEASRKSPGVGAPEREALLDLAAAAPRSAHPGDGAAAVPRRMPRVLGWLLSIPALCGYVYLAVGLWLSLGPGYFEGDAIARTANALYVVSSRDPHVGAIGFIWNPLPSIVQIPLVLVLDPFGLAFLAAPIHSALFGVGSLVILDRILRLLGVGGLGRRVLLLLYGLHPMIVFYAAVGMSETAFFFFMFGAIHQYLRWVRASGPGALIQLSLFSAGTFLVRYEALAFAAGCVVALVVAFLAGKDLEPDRLEAILLTYLVPFAYVVALWIFFNGIFVGDPLYFYRSARSNLGQTATFGLETALAGVVGSIPGATLYSLERWALLMPAIAPITLLGFIRGTFRRERTTLALVFVTGSVPVFTMYMLYAGALAPWLRYFMYGVPFAFVLLPLVLEPLRSARRAWVAGWVVAVVLMVAAVPTSAYAMLTPDFHEESGIVGHIFRPDVFPVANTFATEREIAAYLEAKPERTVTLIDSSFSFPVNLFSRDHGRFVITSDRDFKQISERPDQGVVTHVLVSDPAGGDAVAAALPGFWEAGAGYATLERDFGGNKKFRLYRITPVTGR